MSCFSSIAFKSRDKLVFSIPFFGPYAVEVVPAASIFKIAKPVDIVEWNFDASRLYILLTAIQAERNAPSKLGVCMVLFFKDIKYYACIIKIEKNFSCNYTRLPKRKFYR